MATSNIRTIVPEIARALGEAASIGNVLTKRPGMASNDPLLYLIRPKYRPIKEAYGEMASRWTLDGTVALPTENNDDVELDMLDVITDLLNTSGQNLTAFGSITEGYMQIEEGDTDYYSIHDTPVLAFKFNVVIVERVVYEYKLVPDE